MSEPSFNTNFKKYPEGLLEGLEGHQEEHLEEVLVADPLEGRLDQGGLAEGGLVVGHLEDIKQGNLFAIFARKQARQTWWATRTRRRASGCCSWGKCKLIILDENMLETSFFPTDAHQVVLLVERLLEEGLLEEDLAVDRLQSNTTITFRYSFEPKCCST